MGIIITCDVCGKLIDFGGDWRRLTGGRVACVPCQELVASCKDLDRAGSNLMLFRDAKKKQKESTAMIDDVVMLHKSYTNALQQLLLVQGNEF